MKLLMSKFLVPFVVKKYLKIKIIKNGNSCHQRNSKKQIAH